MTFSDYAREQALKCVSCGECAKACDIMAAVSPRLPGALCASLADGSPDGRLTWFVSRCSLCGRCRFACPEGVDLPGVIVRARGDMTARGIIDTQGYRAMWVDCAWNAITLFRRSYGIDCSPYERKRCEVLYLPGCSLLNEAFELTEPALEWVSAYFGEEAGLLPDCCGMPLLEMGLLSRFEAYERRLWAKIARIGARELVVACPNCLEKLAGRGAREGVRVRSIYELMADAGFCAKGGVGGMGSVAIHDSCPARGTPMGSWVRGVLREYDQVEMRHCGDDSLCCGSGGAVSMIDFPLREVRAERRRAEFEETGADVCVSYCMSSASTLRVPDAPQRSVHVLELAFERLVDHGEHDRRVAAMWEGDLGLANARLLEEPCFVDDEGE